MSVLSSASCVARTLTLRFAPCAKCMSTMASDFMALKLPSFSVFSITPPPAIPVPAVMPVSLVLFLAPLHDAMHTAVMIIANVNVLILIVGVLKLFPYTLITQYFPFCDTPATIFFTNIVKGECNPKPKKPAFFSFWDCRAASYIIQI